MTAYGGVLLPLFGRFLRHILLKGRDWNLVPPPLLFVDAGGGKGARDPSFDSCGPRVWLVWFPIGFCSQLIVYSTWKVGGEAIRGMVCVIVAAYTD